MAVTGLLARSTGFRTIRLTWAPELYTLGYVVFRGTSDDFNQAVMLPGNLGPDVGTYTDYTPLASNRYWYWVLSAPALDSDGPVDAIAGAVVQEVTYEKIVKPLAVWATAATGLPVVWSGQPGIKPVKPFCMMTLTGPIKVPSTDFENDADLTLGGMRRYTVSVNIFTEQGHPDPTTGEPLQVDAMGFAARMVNALDSPATTEAFTAAGIAEAGIESQPQDLSALLDTKFERHVHFDFQINVASNFTINDPGTIEQVDLASVQAAFAQA